MKERVTLKFCLILALFTCLIVRQVFPQNALLWEIRGENGRRSYLYGTIHLKDKRVFEYTDTALSYMHVCDKVAFELDLNPMNMLKYSDMIFLKGDSTLKNIFNESDYTIISKKATEITGMDFMLLERFKPVTLLSVVMQNMLTEDIPYTVDEFFYQEAVKLKKEIIGLETFADQFRVLETIPMEYIIDFLKNPEKSVSDVEPLVTAYRNCNLDKLLKLLQKDETMVALRNDFLDDRNLIMTDKIDKIIQQHSLFVAVGAGHLPGVYGIINLLRQKGYEIYPVILQDFSN